MAALNPQRFIKVLGKTFVQDYAEHCILVIGSDAWTRGELAKLGVVQARACSILNAIATRLKVENVRDLYEQTSPYSLSEFPCGVTTLFVLFAVFLDKGLDPDTWYLAGKEKALITFISLKHRELKARERERTEQKTRSRKTRRQSHERAVKPLLQAAR